MAGTERFNDAGEASAPAEASAPDPDAALVSAAVQEVGLILAKGYNDVARERFGLELELSLLEGGGSEFEIQKVTAQLQQNDLNRTQVLNMMSNLQLIIDGTVTVSVEDLNPGVNWVFGTYKAGKTQKLDTGVHITLDRRVATGHSPSHIDDLAATLVHELTHAQDYLTETGAAYAAAVDKIETADAAYQTLRAGIKPADIQAARAQMHGTINAYNLSTDLESRAYANESLFNTFRGVADNAQTSLTKAKTGAENWSALLKRTPRPPP